MENVDQSKYQQIGKRIESARKKEGLTQGQLATLLDYQSPTAISLIEAGKRSLKATELEKLANFLHCDVNYFLSGSTDRPAVSVRMALRSEHKDLSKPEIDQIENFINFIKNEQRHGRRPSGDSE